MGENIDLSGATITIYYSDGSQITKPASEETAANYDFSKAGQTKVTLQHLNYSLSFDVEDGVAVAW